MSFILSAGISDDLPKYLRDKIIISNQVALLTAAVGLFYAVFSYIFYPSLTIYPVFCIVFSFGAILMNYFGMYNISRFILSTLVLLLAFLYHGFLVQPGEGYITSMYVIEFALTVIPWVLIDFREKPLLVASLLTCTILIFSQTWANDFLAMDLDSSLFRSGFLSVASYGFAIVILISCLLFMQNKNFISEIQNEKLLQDIQVKNAEMEKQQQALEQNLKEITESRQQEEKQNWASKGIAQISEVLQQDDDDQIYSRLLRQIVKYIDANQGGIYLLKDDEEKYLELVSCYAYDREKFIEKRIEIGQGLIGQCYLEQEPIMLKEVPEEYICITSGLGEAPPTFITIIPLIQDKTVVGILELAFFHELETYQVDFLNQLGHSIASFVSSNFLNSQTKLLLEQSQLQMEQLRAQEEEMRQNMEELQATQEEMERKEKEYIGRIQELENQEIES